jgi:hypothetical protein
MCIATFRDFNNLSSIHTVIPAIHPHRLGKRLKILSSLSIRQKIPYPRSPVRFRRHEMAIQPHINSVSIAADQSGLRGNTYYLKHRTIISVEKFL